uniref:Uncharacterized protein n=1 Tax=Glossina pallidipes TaxID=7398 RepID=A0A1B0AEB5_GLOPL
MQTAPINDKQYYMAAKVLAPNAEYGYESSYRNSLDVVNFNINIVLSHSSVTFELSKREDHSAEKLEIVVLLAGQENTENINIVNCNLRLSASTSTIGGMASSHMYHV